nr:hypothetical protein [Selenomonadaceae bacterium]
NSMLKVAEGAVANTVEIISTLKEKVLNAANDTNTDSDRQQIQKSSIKWSTRSTTMRTLHITACI